MKKIYFILFFTVFVVGTSFVPVNNDNGIEIKSKIVSFYPNPASSFINFEFSKSLEKGYTIQMYNFIGRKVLELPVSGNKITVTLDGYYRGIYIFQLRDKSGKIIESGKFQIVK
jgi:hypothetical protein